MPIYKEQDMLRLSPSKESQADELALGKARFKVAAIQAAPTDLIRRHPWSSVLGTAAAGLAAGILLTPRPVQHVHVDGPDAAPGKNGNGYKPAPPPAPKVSWLAPLVSMASNLIQAYLTKQIHDSQSAAAPPGDGRPQGQ
jgi:hypothetical protein